ncbi:MAG: cation diffusion facilitator family transporter, partial [Myxococcales bacterium FL481]
MDTDNRSAVLAAMVANFGIALAKFFGFFMTGAASMLAEGVHSVADSGNQALLLWGGVAAKRDATRLHPFGYGRERFFWSFVVALVLFLFGSVFAIYEGVHKLQDPQPVTAPEWAVGILCLGLVLEGWSFRTAIVGARK